MRILIGHTFGGIDQHQHHVGRFNGLQRLDHRELLDGFKHAPLAAQTCGVDQLKLLTVALKRYGNRIACGARHVERHQTLFTQPGIDQRGFTCVRATGQRQTHRTRLNVLNRVFVLRCLGQVQQAQRLIDQTAHTLTVCGRDGVHLTQAQFVELRQLGAGLHAFGLIGHQHAGLAQTAQVVTDVMVLCRQAITRIHHKQHHIGFSDSLAGLLGHFLEDALGGIRLETTRVDHDVLVLTLSALTVMAVTRQTGKVCDDGVAGLCQPIEQGGFAHIGPPNKGNNWFH